MAKKNNLIEEIQELVQQIKENYQAGVDFSIIGGKNGHPLWVEIKSLQLKKYCREKFDIPDSAKGLFLDYYQSDLDENWVNYKAGIDNDRKNTDLLITTERKEGLINESENCKQCNQLVAKKEGWIQQWDGRKEVSGPSPNIIAYFHPECAKKYFADKEQPNQNEIFRLKEKLLRNLDKICLDPLGDLANAELLKDKETENKYYWKPNYKSSEHKKMLGKIYKVEIEGEEIDLEKYFYLGSENYCELKKAIIQEIKQNLREWKIDFSLEGASLQYVKWMVRHQSGRRHWRIGIERFWPDITERGKYWAEIEVALNGKSSPVSSDPGELTSNDKETIQSYMEKQGIIGMSLVGNKLIVEYKNKPSQKLTINNSELQNIQKCLEKTADKSLSWKQVSGNSKSTNQPKSNYIPLWIGLGVGGGMIIGVLAAYLFKRKESKK